MKLPKNKLDVFMHLYYKVPSFYLIDKLSTVWSGCVNVSMNSEGFYNEEIADYLRSKFERVNILYVENMGSDIYGFYNCYRQYESEKKWIMYLHDKHVSKLDWLDEIVDPIVSKDNLGKIINIINNDSSKYGMICCEKHKRKLDDEEYLVELDKNTPVPEKGRIVRSRQTLLWLRELQYILSSNFGYIKKDNLNFDFMGGNIFIARNEVINISHRCIYPEFFGKYYKEDGEVQHAIERFYFYTNLCLDKDTLYLT